MDIRNNLLVYLREKYIHELSAFVKEEEARQLLNTLIQHFFGFNKIDLAMNQNYRLSESEILLLHFAIKDLKKHRPIQYITGITEFLSYSFRVNESLLIPRPETEELVQLIGLNEKQENLRVLDIGTGSGCIAISLDRTLAKPTVVAIDIDENALELAIENASLNNSPVNFIQLDILDEPAWDELGVFDVIVSNPPYVTINDKEEMEKNVLNYEPHIALFVPEGDELIFYKKICLFAQKHLAEKGRIYFELNENKGFEIETLLNQNGFHSVKLHQDFRGRTRFSSASKSKTDIFLIE